MPAVISSAASEDIVVLREGPQRARQGVVVGELRIWFAESCLLQQVVLIVESGCQQIPTCGSVDVQTGWQRVEIDLVVVEDIGDQVRADDSAIPSFQQKAF